MMVVARRGAALGAAFGLGFWLGLFTAPRSYTLHTRGQRR